MIGNTSLVLTGIVMCPYYGIIRPILVFLKGVFYSGGLPEEVQMNVKRLFLILILLVLVGSVQAAPTQVSAPIPAAGTYVIQLQEGVSTNLIGTNMALVSARLQGADVYVTAWIAPGYTPTYTYRVGSYTNMWGYQISFARTWDEGVVALLTASTPGGPNH